MLDAVRDFLHDGAWTDYPTPVVVSVFIVICAIGIAFFVPKTLFAPAAGALFGAINGTVIVMTGATLGSVLALMLGRRLGRERVRALLHRKQALADLDARLTRHGVLPVTVLRLVPVMPGFVVNYGAAATGISTLHFVVGTVIGLLPATMLQVAAGASVRSGLSLPVVVIGTVGVLTVLVGLLVFRRRGARPAPATGPGNEGEADRVEVSPQAGTRPDGAA